MSFTSTLRSTQRGYRRRGFRTTEGDGAGGDGLSCREEGWRPYTPAISEGWGPAAAQR